MGLAVSAAYEYVTSAERLGHVAEAVAASSVVTLDTETTGLFPHNARVRLLSLGTQRGAFVVDLDQTRTLGPLRDVLHNPQAETGAHRPLVVAQNAKFDQKFLLHHYGIELWPVFDTFRASAMVYNGKSQPNGRPLSHDLWSLYRRELRQEPTVLDLGGSDWSAPVLTRAQLDYAADDVLNLTALYGRLRSKLADLGMLKVAAVEFGAILPESAVELNGFYLNARKWLNLSKDNKLKADAFAVRLLRELPHPKGLMLLPGAEQWMLNTETLEKWADEFESGDIEEDEYAALMGTLARAKTKGAAFNLGSSQQVLQSLRKLSPKLKDLSTTNEMDLALWAKEFPVIDLLFDYREALTALKSFGPHYLSNIRPETGRIHADYFPLLKGGRYAHSKPNLGQIPRGKEYRSCFEPAPGCRFVIADFSNVEMRLAAEVSGDATLCRVFKDGMDAHRFTAAMVNKKPESEVTKAERQQAKPCIAQGSLVLTDHGLKPIETVLLTDRVWDGVEWVEHEGVVYKGYREVLEHDGLVATPDHFVFLEDGDAIPFRRAASALAGRRLAVGADRSGAVRYAAPYRRAQGEGETALHRMSLRSVLEVLLGVRGESVARLDDQLSLSARSEVPRPPGEGTGGALRCHSPALSHSYAPELQELRGTRDRTALHFEGALHPLDARTHTPRHVQGTSDRPDEQRRSLRAGESAARHAGREPEKPAAFAHVYDIVNAGPRHRFTVSGRVVANCNFGYLYSMGWERFILYAAKGYKVTVTPREAQALRAKWFEVYSGIAKWHERALEEGKRTHMARSILGRVRYFDDKAHGEILNHAIQCSGSDGLKHALRKVYFRLRALDPRIKMVHHVHDEIVLECPDEPELVAQAKRELSAGMVAGFDFVKRVPIEAEAADGLSWADKG